MVAALRVDVRPHSRFPSGKTAETVLLDKKERPSAPAKEAFVTVRLPAALETGWVEAEPNILRLAARCRPADGCSSTRFIVHL